MNPLQPFADEIWIADGPEVRTLGIAFPTRMIVVRLHDGSLWINSPVEASRDEARRVEELGRVAHLVAPTPLHAWRLAQWHQFFPDARQWFAPPVHRRSRGTANLLEDAPPPAWAGDLDQLVFRGNAFVNEVYFLHRASRTLVIGDFIQRYARRPHRPVLNLAMRLGGVLDEGGVGIDIRMTFFDRRRARESLNRLLAWDFEKVILAHGAPIERDGKSYVARAFSWLGSARAS